jgi:hypothetical protein
MISILISTIGRDGLIGVIRAIKRDSAVSNISYQICIYLDETNPEKNILDLLESDKNIVFEQNLTGTRRGPGFGYNRARFLANGQYFTFFSDDDEWLEGRLKVLYSAVEGKMNFVAQTQVLHKQGNKVLTRPVQPVIWGKSLADSIFKNLPPWKRNKNYVTLISFIFTANMLSTPFEEDLFWYEDLIWLIRVSSEYSHAKFSFVKVPTASINTSYGNSIPRINIEATKKIQSLLSEHEEVFSRVIRQYMGRPLILTGQTRQLKLLGSLDPNPTFRSSLYFSIAIQLSRLANFYIKNFSTITLRE